MHRCGKSTHVYVLCTTWSGRNYCIVNIFRSAAVQLVRTLGASKWKWLSNCATSAVGFNPIRSTIYRCTGRWCCTYMSQHIVVVTVNTYDKWIAPLGTLLKNSEYILSSRHGYPCVHSLWDLECARGGNGDRQSWSALFLIDLV